MTEDKNLPSFLSLGLEQANLEGLAALQQLAGSTLRYATLREEEKTKRASFEAAKEVEIARIKAAEELMRQYFDRVFAERDSNFSEMFLRLDAAIESQDSQAIQALVGGIVTLAKESPLAGIQDFATFWSELGTPDRPLEL